MEHTGCALALPSQELQAQRRVSVRSGHPPPRAQDKRWVSPEGCPNLEKRRGRLPVASAGMAGGPRGPSTEKRFSWRGCSGALPAATTPSPPVPFFRVTGSTRRILGVVSRNTHWPLSGQGSLWPLGGGWTPPAGEAELLQDFSWAAELSTAEVLERQPRRALASRPPGSPLHALRGSAPSLPPGL